MEERAYFEERRQVGEEEHGRRLNSLQAAWQEEKEGWELQKEEIQAVALAKWENFSRNGKNA